MKRKADGPAGGKKPTKKRSKNTLSAEDAQARFRKGLFEKAVLDKHTSQYASSSPYKHSVISDLVDDALLRKVRSEIKTNVHFTPKETDIYKIHQSGDLANLDGLDDEALSKLPSLLALRDALYSQTFRDYVSHITNCGPLSGRKTDMAINVYTPGCYLLCHDDVIGSRKVSYILYLTDPDTPWQPEWGGALRLFPAVDREGKDGEVAKTPLPDVVKVIPPAWNQLSFFAVQPGESFHDVEEVYHAASKEELEKNGGRIRMAISGWFHIPQIGEDGYVEGAEEKAALKSSLMQLQGNPDQHDLPQAKPVPVEKGDDEDTDDFPLDEADLEFLLKYIAPTYLTPDTIERVADHFEEEFSITLPDILHPKFAEKLRKYVELQEAKALPEDAYEIEKGAWRVARPPHKHRYLYLQPGQEKAGVSPLKDLLEALLPSRQFRLWLQMATRSSIESHDVLARRFRRGKDYTLATGHDGKPRLEVNIGLTPTDGWGDVEDDEDDADSEASSEAEDDNNNKKNARKAVANGKGKGNADSSNTKSKGKGKAVDKEAEPEEEDEDQEVGGHEVYMAGDDDSNEDAAIYKSSADDDNILFFQAAAWNKMSIVLRDSGTLRFVKYVSASAKGDRWDISGTFEIEEQDEEPDEEEDGNGEGGSGAGVLEESEEEEFNGFSDSGESESD